MPLRINANSEVYKMPTATKTKTETLSSQQIDLRRRKLEQDAEGLLREYFTLAWKAAFARNDEDREAHRARAAEIRAYLDNAYHLDCAALVGKYALMQNTERAVEIAALRDKADTYDRRAAEAETKLSQFVDPIDRTSEANRIAALRSEAKGLRKQADLDEANGLLARMLEGPRARIHEAEMRMTRLTAEWQAKSKTIDNHARAMISGPNSQAEYEEQMQGWRQQTSEAQDDIRRASEAIDIDDPATWPGVIRNEVTQRANTLRRQMQERLNQVVWP